MSRHNYTNPAFCQQSEFYPNVHVKQNNTDLNGNNGVHRSESTRSIQSAARKVGSSPFRKHQNTSQVPPKPGPKPNFVRNDPTEGRAGSGRYALVPVEELNPSSHGRYAVVPGPEPQLNHQRFTKSQDNIDRYSHVPAKEGNSSFNEESDRFTSLPPIPHREEEPRLKSAFSSDFGSKSFVLVDQKSNQRYAVVPTAEDEEIVDDNHEIIQMHNGRAHRYAVIPTDEEETCLNNSAMSMPMNHNYASIPDGGFRSPGPLKSSTPHKKFVQMPQSNPGTPIKNNLATQKLHELLSTPRKSSVQRRGSISRNSSRRYQSQIISTIISQDSTPQKIVYDTKDAYLEARTTAVITPRVARSVTDEEADGDTSLNKTWHNASFQKVANATATIGIVSLMLILGGTLNSGLCLYMVSNIGRSYYLDIGVISGFAAIGLGILGFRSRHCDWLPNRNYISGFILVTVLSMVNCCGLLILLALQPLPGTPLHDVTTGVILGLSALIILLISLGVITSRWCRAPPPDNRVDVY